MCRFVAYMGPELTLDLLTTRPIHSIVHQSFKSEEREEPLNGDGFGVGWYAPEVGPEPAVFRSITPAWNDVNLQHLARVTRSGCVFAHVRAASPGLGVSQRNCHPFTSGRWLFMHNGYVPGFGRVRRPLTRALSDRAYHAIGGSTDSEHLFAVGLDALAAAPADADPAAAMSDALRAIVCRADALRRDAGVEEGCQLNLALTDGQRLVVSRYATGGLTPNSLYTHTGKRYVCVGDRCQMIDPDSEGSAVLIASEPLSRDPGWDLVPANHLVVVRADRNLEIVEV